MEETHRPEKGVKERTTYGILMCKVNRRRRGDSMSRRTNDRTTAKILPDSSFSSRVAKLLALCPRRTDGRTPARTHRPDHGRDGRGLEQDLTNGARGERIIWISSNFCGWNCQNNVTNIFYINVDILAISGSRLL